MSSLFVLVDEPKVKVDLQLVDCRIEFFPKRHAIELVEHGFVESLENAVGVRAAGLGAAVIDILDRQAELVFMPVLDTAELGAAARESRSPTSL